MFHIMYISYSLCAILCSWLQWRNNDSVPPGLQHKAGVQGVTPGKIFEKLNSIWCILSMNGSCFVTYNLQLSHTFYMFKMFCNHNCVIMPFNDYTLLFTVLFLTIS